MFTIDPKEFLKEEYYEKVDKLTKSLGGWKNAYYKLLNDFLDAEIIIADLEREIDELKKKYNEIK